MITDYFRHAGTIRHAPPVLDGSGNPVVDTYGNPVSATATQVDVLDFLEPLSETEQLVEAQTYRTTFRLFLDPTQVISEHDLYLNRQAVPSLDIGQQLEVLEVLPFVNPRTNEPHHIECKLVKVVG